jgi:alkanesulfonate monooxygenase SsuD/methylene tetrahydromethanopterin reductase-like flavin-dependent oxidoreductase (luciferase family)
MLFRSSIDQPFDFDGEFFRFKQAFLETSKVHGNGPPLYVGAQGKLTRQIAGELADGWYPWLHTLDSYGDMVSEVNEAARKADRNPDEVDKVAVVYLAITNDPEKVLQNVSRNMKKSLLLERKVLAQYSQPIGSAPSAFTHLSFVASRSNFDLLDKAAESVPLEIVKKVCAIGTADYVKEIVEKYIKIGSTHIVIRPFRSDDIVSFAKEVIPYFKDTQSMANHRI